jgi:5-methylcytosine-specific restriction protein A
MPTRPQSHRPRLPKPAEQRGTANERGYNYAWQKARLAYLREHPLCRSCFGASPQIIRAAEIVDHIVPHRGDLVLFWDQANWQALCPACHNAKTGRGE